MNKMCIPFSGVTANSKKAQVKSPEFVQNYHKEKKARVGGREGGGGGVN